MTSRGKRRLGLLFVIIAGLVLITFSLVNYDSLSYGTSVSSAPGAPPFDYTPPITTIAFANPQYADNGTLFINTNTTIFINASDTSGIIFTHYEIWKDSDNNMVFENDELVLEDTVSDGDLDDMDVSPNISLQMSIASSCSHKITAYSIDTNGNVEAYGWGDLVSDWNYTLQPKTYHWANGGLLVFGSSPAIANLHSESPELEIVCGSDEVGNYYPETPSFEAEGGIWRCWDANGTIVWATPTGTDEARSSPAICDIEGDGTLEIVGGTTSGWNLEVLNSDGSFLLMSCKIILI